MPIFLEAWWLDAVAGETWDVALVEKGGHVFSAMPYTLQTRKPGLLYLGQPTLTQHLGPWLKDQPGKYAKKLSREKDLMQALITQLPVYASFKQNWSYRVQNWLPFFWKGFSQTTGYTYVIPDLSDLDEVFSQFQDKVRTDIRKAEGRNGLIVSDTDPLEVFLQLNKKVFERQSMEQANSDAFVSKLVSAAQKHNRVKWFVASDNEGRPHAGVMVVWDEHSAYYIMGGGDPELRNSGATSLCMWEAIKFSSTVTKCFDFEGSMIEPVERFFRGFGAKQMPYFSVSHTPSRFLRIAKALKAVL